MLAEMMPLPSEETTPPVTKMYFVFMSFIVLFVPVDVCLIDQPYSSCCGVVAAEVPVAGVVGAGLMESFERLEDELYGGGHAVGTEEVEHLGGYFISGEGLVDVLYIVVHLFGRKRQLLHTFQVDVVECLPTAMFDVELHCCTEGDEFVEVRHVDAVVVGIAHLRTGTDEHHLLGVQSVEDADDAFAEGGAPHDGVVDDDEVVNLWFQ